MKIRKSNRLANYDYSQNGMYFITICIKDMEESFGKVIDSKMILNNIGKIALKCYLEIPNHFPHIHLDEFVIMPNHTHGILEIINDFVSVPPPVRDAYMRPVQAMHAHPTQTQIDRSKMLLSKAVHGFKSSVTRKIFDPSFPQEHPGAFPTKFAWKRSFHDRVIRNDIELNRIREYIQNNPANWERDSNNKEGILI